MLTLIISAALLWYLVPEPHCGIKSQTLYNEFGMSWPWIESDTSPSRSGHSTYCATEAGNIMMQIIGNAVFTFSVKYTLDSF